MFCLKGYLFKIGSFSLEPLFIVGSRFDFPQFRCLELSLLAKFFKVSFLKLVSP